MECHLDRGRGWDVYASFSSSSAGFLHVDIHIQIPVEGLVNWFNQQCVCEVPLEIECVCCVMCSFSSSVLYSLETTFINLLKEVLPGFQWVDFGP